MRQVTPLGLVLSKLLIGLFLLEVALYGAGKLLTRRSFTILPPTFVGDWKVGPGEPPSSNLERDNPREISVQYTSGKLDPVHVDFALIQTVNGMRLPQKYLADSDGRINPLNTVILKHDDKDAFSLSLVQGIEADTIAVHWVQAPGGDPRPFATQLPAKSLKSIVLHQPLYTCDAWIAVHPTTIGSKSRVLLQQFADALADSIKHGH